MGSKSGPSCRTGRSRGKKPLTEARPGHTGRSRGRSLSQRPDPATREGVGEKPLTEARFSHTGRSGGRGLSQRPGSATREEVGGEASHRGQIRPHETEMMGAGPPPPGGNSPLGLEALSRSQGGPSSVRAGPRRPGSLQQGIKACTEPRETLAGGEA